MVVTDCALCFFFSLIFFFLAFIFCFVFFLLSFSYSQTEAAQCWMCCAHSTLHNRSRHNTTEKNQVTTTRGKKQQEIPICSCSISLHAFSSFFSVDWSSSFYSSPLFLSFCLLHLLSPPLSSLLFSSSLLSVLFRLSHTYSQDYPTPRTHLTMRIWYPTAASAPSHTCNNTYYSSNNNNNSSDNIMSNVNAAAYFPFRSVGPHVVSVCGCFFCCCWLPVNYSGVCLLQEWLIFLFRQAWVNLSQRGSDLIYISSSHT